jgi:hypothetical protein
MSLLEGFDEMQLVKVGPSLRERLERRVAAAGRARVIACLRRFREDLERDTEPESWVALEVPMVLVLSDVCQALELTGEEQGIVLGQEGLMALRRETAIRPLLLAGVLNDRQIAVLTCVRKHGEITLSAYRAICPHWSDETLRLDLADLVEHGLLIKNGRKKGTRYTLPGE